MGNDEFVPAQLPPGLPPLQPSPPYDFVQIGTYINFGGEVPDAAGFTIGDYRLIGARIFWIEDYAPQSTPDFLTSDDLLATLPDLGGRLALDFVTGTPADLSTFKVAYYFVDDVRVRPVPEPTSLSLLAIGALALGGAWRFRRAATPRT